MFLEKAIEAAKAAGAIQKKYFGKEFKVQIKGKRDTDLLTEVDTICEETIIKILSETYPEHYILAEESGYHKKGTDHGYNWIIDPIDGTTNFAHGFPFFCSSIALEVDGDIKAATVYAPILDELFYAEKGKGAFLNGNKVQISKVSNLNSSLLATGFPYDIRESANNNFDHFMKFAVKTQGIRRAGSAALDLCYLAAGRVDGFWELKLKPWDTAAASLIVQEAGGLLTNFKGEEYSIYGCETLASNGIIHKEMIETLLSSVMLPH